MKTLASTKALGLALFGLVAGGCSFSFGSGGPYTNSAYGKPVYNNYSYETDARNTRPKPVKKASRADDRADDRAAPPKRTPKAEPPRRTKPSDPPPTRAGRTPTRDSDARPLSRDRDTRRPTRDPKADAKKPTREPTRGRTFEPGSDEPARKGEVRRPTRTPKSEPARRPAPNRLDPDQSDTGKTKDTRSTRRGRTLGRS